MYFFVLFVTVLLVVFGVLLVKNVTHGEIEAMSMTDLMFCFQQSHTLFHHPVNAEAFLGLA